LLVDVNYWQLVGRFPMGGGSAEGGGTGVRTGWVFVPIGVRPGHGRRRCLLRVLASTKLASRESRLTVTNISSQPDAGHGIPAESVRAAGDSDLRLRTGPSRHFSEQRRSCPRQ
jgi:hypothetical protein